MAADHSKHPIVHFVGSIPLPDAEPCSVPSSKRPGLICCACPMARPASARPGSAFSRTVLAENPAIEVANDVPPFKFTQWDGKVLREIPRLRIKPGAKPDPDTFKTGYAEMAIASWSLFDACRKPASFPRKSNFRSRSRRRSPQPTTTWRRRTARRCCPRSPQHFIGEVDQIAAAIPMIASPCNGTCARKCWPGKAITKRDRSISATRRSAS